MENTVKITKAMKLAAVEAYFTENADITLQVGDVDVTASDIVEYAVKEQESLAKKAAKAKEKAAEKKIEGDELRDAVKAVLTDEYQVIGDIFPQVADEAGEITTAKVTYRLTALVKAGIAEKAEVKVSGEGEKTRKVMGYRLVDREQATEGYVE